MRPREMDKDQDKGGREDEQNAVAAGAKHGGPSPLGRELGVSRSRGKRMDGGRCKK